MCLISCDICHINITDLSLEKKHICKEEDIKKRMDDIETQLTKSHRRSDKLYDAIQKFVSETSEEELAEKDSIRLKRLEELYKATDSKYDYLYTFWNQNRMMHLVLIEAAEIFTSKQSRSYENGGKIDEKLQILLKTIKSTYKVLGYKDKFDISVDAVIKELKDVSLN